MKSIDLLQKNDPVEMLLSEKYHDVGLIKSVDVISKASVPYNFKDKIKTPYAYKVSYFINMPGLVLPDFVVGKAVKDNNGEHKLRLAPLDGMPIALPKASSPYTILEPMRLSDFLAWQYKAAETLTETNINIIGDKQFKKTMTSTADSVDKLAQNLNKVMDAADAEETGKNLKIISQNLAQISESVNNMTKDDNLKNQLTSAITNVNNAMAEVATALDTVNRVNPNNPGQATDLQRIVNDTVVTTANLRKFSEKLNKRFLLFRLLF